MKYLKFSSILIIFLVLGCTTVRNTVRKLDKSDEYKNAPMPDKTIIVPTDIDIDEVEDHYPIPKVPNNNRSVDVSMEPPKVDADIN